MEAVVVIAILATLASLIVPQLSSLRFRTAGQDQTTEQIVTSGTLGTIRASILGTADQPGLWQDLGQRPDRFPRFVADLLRPATNLPPSLQQFNAVTRLGWRGPYLAAGGGFYSLDVSHGFTADYGTNGDPTVLDAWGRPIVLQVPKVAGVTFQDELLNARLVSAGPDGTIQTPIDKLTPGDLSTSDRGDDLILFLRVSDQP